MKILKKTVLYFSENAFQINMIFVRFSPTIAQKKFDTKIVKKFHRAPRNRGDGFASRQNAVYWAKRKSLRTLGVLRLTRNDLLSFQTPGFCVEEI